MKKTTICYLILFSTLVFPIYCTDLPMEISSTLKYVEQMKCDMQKADTVKYISEKKPFDFESKKYKASLKERLDSACKAQGIIIENYPSVYGLTDFMLSGIGMMRLFLVNIESCFDFIVLLLFYAWVLFQLAVLHIWKKKFLFLIGHYLGCTLGLMLAFVLIPFFPFALIIYILLAVLIIREVRMIKNDK